jgi:hypothetical protein
LIHYKSVEEDSPLAAAYLSKFNPPSINVIRCHTQFSGYIIEPIEEEATGSHPQAENPPTPPPPLGTRLTIISNNDMKGIIPKTIFDMIAKKAPF